jgi:hypothetical protein
MVHHLKRSRQKPTSQAILQKSNSSRTEVQLAKVVVDERVAPEDADYGDKCVVVVTRQTPILEDDGRGRRPASFCAHAVGQREQASFHRRVKESYTAHVEADQIVIVK